MTFFYDLLDTTSEQSEAIAKVVFVREVEVESLLLSPDFLNYFFVHPYKIIASNRGLTHYLKA
jgi:hypothetical protein